MSTAARRFWRRIDVRHVNLVLLVALVACVALFRDDLRWAAAELPRYLRGSIGRPVERGLCFRASKLIREGRDLERAREMLERSLAIDPHTDAVYWLAEYDLARDEPARALELLQSYLELDPTRVEAHLKAAELLRADGRDEEARELLERGLEYFVAMRPQLEPRPDPGVPMRFNDKAIGLYAYCGSAVERLRAALTADGVTGDEAGRERREAPLGREPDVR
jgi:tetratricopeptide (TPR) repeat protein